MIAIIILRLIENDDNNFEYSPRRAHANFCKRHRDESVGHPRKRARDTATAATTTMGATRRRRRIRSNRWSGNDERARANEQSVAAVAAATAMRSAYVCARSLRARGRGFMRAVVQTLVRWCTDNVCLLGGDGGSSRRRRWRW